MGHEVELLANRSSKVQAEKYSNDGYERWSNSDLFLVLSQRDFEFCSKIRLYNYDFSGFYSFDGDFIWFFIASATILFRVFIRPKEKPLGFYFFRRRSASFYLFIQRQFYSFIYFKAVFLLLLFFQQFIYQQYWCFILFLFVHVSKCLPILKGRYSSQFSSIIFDI